MTDYHIDGFRFDQAHLLSAETARFIIDELKKIKKQLKGYKFSAAELEKKNKQGMKLKDVLSKVWMGGKIK